MKPSELAQAIEACIEVKRPAMTWSGPGMGKSAITRQVADKVFGPALGYTVENGVLYDAKGRPTTKRPYFIDLRLVLLDPVDLRGLPSLKDGLTHWAYPDFLPTEGKGVLFMDEINAAAPSVQAAAYQLVLDRKLGDYELPDGWVVMAAGNREEDGAVVHRMATPLKNRFEHLTLDVDKDEWCKWALQNNVNPMVIAYIRFRPENLHKFSRTENAFPTPRSWEFVSQFADLNKPKMIELALYKGAVGDGAGIEFMAFVDMYRKLPSVDAIIHDPKKAPLFDKPNMQYAVASALARAMTDENIDRVVTYLNRMPVEFNVMAVKDAITRDADLQGTKEFTTWAIRHSDVVF
jgi:hypothetical protein